MSKNNKPSNSTEIPNSSKEIPNKSNPGSTIIDARDFFNHDKRITLIEQSLTQIDKRFDKFEADVDRRFNEIDKRFDKFESDVDRSFDLVDKRFEKVDSRFEKLESMMNTQFKWIMGTMGGLALTVIVSLLTMIAKVH